MPPPCSWRHCMELECRPAITTIASPGFRMPMIDGDMQHFSLTLNKFLEHAAKWHPEGQVVNVRESGAHSRIGYANLMERSLRISALLGGFGVRMGSRVATLAWNTQAHLEASYAIMGIGAVWHTLNPRLTCEHLADMVIQSEVRLMI